MHLGDDVERSCGVEVGGQAHVVAIEVTKGSVHVVPLVETDEAYYSYGFGKIIDEATIMTNNHMIHLLVKESDLTFIKTGMLKTIKVNVLAC